MACIRTRLLRLVMNMISLHVTHFVALRMSRIILVRFNSYAKSVVLYISWDKGQSTVEGVPALMAFQH